MGVLDREAHQHAAAEVGDGWCLHGVDDDVQRKIRLLDPDRVVLVRTQARDEHVALCAGLADELVLTIDPNAVLSAHLHDREAVVDRPGREDMAAQERNSAGRGNLREGRAGLLSCLDFVVAPVRLQVQCSIDRLHCACVRDQTITHAASCGQVLLQIQLRGGTGGRIGSGRGAQAGARVD